MNCRHDSAEIREAVLDILSDIAPDDDLSGLKDDVSFREQLELDSMDFLDIVMELRKRYRVQVPEEDYPQLAQHGKHRGLSRTADEGPAKGLDALGASALDGASGSDPSGFGPCSNHDPTLRPTMAMYDTIIIGAGMSGLAAGIRLAYFDRRVCILERHTTIGGLNSFYRRRRPQLRRRPARRDQLHAQRRDERAAGPVAAAVAIVVGRLLRWRRKSARGSRFPA